jgi:hypothetical protein
MTEEEIDNICGTYYCEKDHPSFSFRKGEILKIFRSERHKKCNVDVRFINMPHNYSNDLTYTKIELEIFPYATKLSPEELMIKDIIE